MRRQRSYASLLLERPTDAYASRRIATEIDELTRRATVAGTVHPGTTPDDVRALILAMRGLVQATGEAAPADWRRFLDIHLARPRAAEPQSSGLERCGRRRGPSLPMDRGWVVRVS